MFANFMRCQRRLGEFRCIELGIFVRQTHPLLIPGSAARIPLDLRRPFDEHQLASEQGREYLVSASPLLLGKIEVELSCETHLNFLLGHGLSVPLLLEGLDSLVECVLGDRHHMACAFY